MSDTTKKRTVLTPEEKIAKLEAELQAVRDKAVAKRAKAVAAAQSKLDNINSRMLKLGIQATEIIDQFPELGKKDEEADW